MQGTGRPSMEDTYNVAIDAKGSDPSFFGVFDGHGGIAVAEYVFLVFFYIQTSYLRAYQINKQEIFEMTAQDNQMYNCFTIE